MEGLFMSTTTIILIIVGVLALGLCAWSWYFENGGKDDSQPQDTENK